ncbi:MAG: hypothetical protein V2I37_01450 [Marinilabiliaceae bacterium]|jgi:hypothetical protein|nr:hypothetical protein [Marinilabiliaceae bacterium]
MNRRHAGIISVAFIIICIGYIIYDVSTGKSDNIIATVEKASGEQQTNWVIEREFHVDYGILNAIKVTYNNSIICGGDSFLALYDEEFNETWKINTPRAIFALAFFNDTIYAASQEEILIFSIDGDSLDTWGPYDDNAILTSISANKEYVAFADAGNQLVFVCDRYGALKSLVGRPGKQFIIPSAYFDIMLTESNQLVVANTGKRQIEFRNIDGELTRSFGDEGDELKDFCGCCNPSHFDISPEGLIITAEKGINRIKVLDLSGRLVEPVTISNSFVASIPLDISLSPSGEIYAANRGDSNIYVFKRNH